MAYMKYKELTKTFRFKKKLPINNVPEFISQYVSKDEDILAVYGTKEDACLFTDKKLVLFDIGRFTGNKKIHILPYNKINTTTIEFSFDFVKIYFSFDSGYQTKVKFVHFNPEDKTELRKIYLELVSKICKN